MPQTESAFAALKARDSGPEWGYAALRKLGLRMRLGMRLGGALSLAHFLEFAEPGAGSRPTRQGRNQPSGKGPNASCTRTRPPPPQKNILPPQISACSRPPHRLTGTKTQRSQGSGAFVPGRPRRLDQAGDLTFLDAFDAKAVIFFSLGLPCMCSSKMPLLSVVAASLRVPRDVPPHPIPRIHNPQQPQ